METGENMHIVARYHFIVYNAYSLSCYTYRWAPGGRSSLTLSTEFVAQ